MMPPLLRYADADATRRYAVRQYATIRHYHIMFASHAAARRVSILCLA